MKRRIATISVAAFFAAVFITLIVFRSSPSPHGQTASAGSVRNSASDRPIRPVRELMRDFGLVAPESENVHQFTIQNTGTAVWSLKSIRVGCACTATEMSAREIQPGATETIDVRYTPGAKTGDELRDVLVEFKEPEAPAFRLVVKARVRRPMTCGLDEIMISACHGEQQPAGRSIVVQNFGTQRWTGVSADTQCDWLRVSANEIAGSVPRKTAGDDVVPSQVFTVNISAVTESLPVGLYSERLRLKALDADDVTAVVLVQLTVDPAIRVVPKSLYFGECGIGVAATSRARFILASHVGVEHVDVDERPRATIPDRLAGNLSLEWKRLSARTWELSAQFRPAADTGDVIDEPLVVSFGKSPLGTVELPIKALLANAAPAARGEK